MFPDKADVTSFKRYHADHCLFLFSNIFYISSHRAIRYRWGYILHGFKFNSIFFFKKNTHLISHHINSQQWKIKQAAKWDNMKKRKTNNYVCCKWTRMKRKSATEKCLTLRWRIGKNELDTNVHLKEQSCSNHDHSTPQNGISA